MPCVGGGLTGSPGVVFCVKGRAVDRHAAITDCQALCIKIVEMLSQVFLVQPGMIVPICVVVTGTQLFIEGSTASRRRSYPREDVGRHGRPRGNGSSMGHDGHVVVILSVGADDGRMIARCSGGDTVKQELRCPEKVDDSLDPGDGDKASIGSEGKLYQGKLMSAVLSTGWGRLWRAGDHDQRD